MARECFCGCGRSVARSGRKLNKRGGDLTHFTGQLETYVVPFQEAYLLFALRRELEPDELQRAREGVEDSRGLVEAGREIRGMVAVALHADDPAALREQSVAEIADSMKKMVVHVRTTCIKGGVSYDLLPTLGAKGIADLMDAEHSG